MDLRQLEAFVRVAELGSFSKAALVLRIAQPALSRQVRRLEVELEETLLERTGRGVRLTEPGRRFLDHAAGILQSVADARGAVGASRHAPTGRVTVGMPPSIGRRLVPGLVEAFARRWPQARLTIVEAMSAHLGEWIATGRIDLALVHNPEPHEAIEVVPVLEEALCLVSPRAASGRARPPGRSVPMAALPGLSLVLPDRSHAIRRLLEAQAALAGLRLQVAWEVASIPSIIDLVALGYGHAVLTRSAVAISDRAGALLARPLTDPGLTSTLCLAAPATRRASTLAREVHGLLGELARGLGDAGSA